MEFGGVYKAKVVEIIQSGLMITFYKNQKKPVLLSNYQIDRKKVLLFKVSFDENFFIKSFCFLLDCSWFSE
jgi:hypothetical protein